MLNTKTTTISALSRTSLTPLKVADTYSLSSTNNIPFQTNTNLYVTANPSQTFYQPHTAPNVSASASVSPESLVLIVIPTNPLLVITIIYTVPFVAINKLVKKFDGLDHQYIPEENIHQTDAHVVFTTGKLPLDPLAYNQWNEKMAFWQLFLSGIASSKF